MRDSSLNFYCLTIGVEKLLLTWGISIPFSLLVSDCVSAEYGDGCYSAYTLLASSIRIRVIPLYLSPQVCLVTLMSQNSNLIACYA